MEQTINYARTIIGYLVLTLIVIGAIFALRPVSQKQANQFTIEPTPDRSYLRLTARATNQTTEIISGWRLRSASGGQAIIPDGANPFQIGVINPSKPIILAPAESAIITPGESPVGISFRANQCSGYLEQFQIFSPPFPADCPRAESRISEPDCLAYLDTLPACTMPLRLPPNLSPACRIMLVEENSYNACFKNHSTDIGFDREWRIFLGNDQSVTLWATSTDTIFLFNQAGRLITATSF